MKTLAKWRRYKFTKEIVVYGSDMPLDGLWKQTGSWGIRYSSQRRHRWIGVSGLFGIRYSVYW